MGNVILTSIGLSSDAVYKYVQNLVQVNNYRSAVIITTASPQKEKKKSIALTQKQLEDIGIKNITFFDFDCAKNMKALEQADVIYVAGGNTFYLLDRAQKFGFSQFLDKYLDSKIYIGTSAGSCLLGSDIQHLEDIGMDENSVGLLDTFALSRISKKIIPHVEDWHEKEFGNDPEYLLIRDGEAVVCSSVKPFTMCRI